MVLDRNSGRQLRRFRMLPSVTGSERFRREDAAGNDAEVSINEQHRDTAGVLGGSLPALRGTRAVSRRIHGAADQRLSGKDGER